ncbi:DNA helicase PcrA [Desulfofalx alkaliphila]|uniref:DNA helicase PcrA n=1 Tax=Desulfofalx alkaliphila TaxID=105483 RepID=UPI0004E25E22|nr:DNA helicase PcrA [Desulfofalx alkaliphila]
MEHILENLNEAQRQAVQQTEGPVLVLAGAGSGKTRVLTHRIAYLLKEGVAPWNILAITFTNKAAREMRDRVEQMVSASQARELWVSTFHSACLRILRREIQALGYDRNFVIYDDADQQTVIKECLKELNIDDKRFSARSISAAISAAKNKLMEADRYLEQAEDFYTQTVARVYQLYQQNLLINNAVDFDDLLLLTVKLFEQHSHVLTYYQDRFKYILVDEYQDTNQVQYVLVNMLAQRHRNLCVVGDPNQSIYRWRGADIENILNFERDYKEARVIKLEQNYRSTQTILEAANAVIAHNASSKKLKLWTALGEGEPIVFKYCQDERDEGYYLSRTIRRLVSEEGYRYSDFAVLYRTHAQSRAIEERLMTANIPYNIVGGLKFYDRKEIKDLLAYLRLLVNPRDAVAFQRIINVPKRGIGPASVAKMQNWAAENKVGLVDALANAAVIPGLTAKVRAAAAELADMFGQLKEQEGYLSVTDLVEQVLERSGYLNELKKEDTVESRTRIENLQEFYTVTKEYDLNNEEGSLEDFLANISLVTDLDSYQGDANAVSLMSLHMAKGLEFPVVFLTGMEEGIFPHLRSLDEPEEMEEERRICYVGITRARRLLYLTYCWSRTLYGRTQNNLPSRFIEEIPDELISRDVLHQSGSNNSIRTSPAGASKEVGTFLLGDNVVHRKWGEGVVVAVKGEGKDAEIKVAFPEQGIKTLIAQYAPLEKVTK